MSEAVVGWSLRHLVAVRPEFVLSRLGAVESPDAETDARKQSMEGRFQMGVSARGVSPLESYIYPV
eukprot:8675018-Pyramimonas_sp.AAC.1